MPAKASPTQDAIKQGKPFRSARQEAGIALFLAADAVRRRFAGVFADADITAQQYNVLRILRGAGKTGLPTLEIGERMIEKAPGVTRLIDRLEEKGLVVRDRPSHDRRMVLCRIAEAGLKLLAELDLPVDRTDDDVFSGLDDREVAALVDLLTKVRLTKPTT